MLILLYSLIVFSVQRVILITPDYNIKTPFGPMMCSELCGKLVGCLNPVFVRSDLRCDPSNVEENRTQDHNEVNKFNTIQKTPRKVAGRLITTNSGRRVTVYFNSNREAGINHANHRYRPDNRTTFEKMFALQMPSKVRTQNCTVLSMAKSVEHTDIIYLLLYCQKMEGCRVRLRFADMKTKMMLKNKVKFCQSRVWKIQLFTGPCVKNEQNSCVFSVRDTLKQLYLTSYKEPPLKSRELKTEKEYFHNGYHGKPIVCSVYMPRKLLCILNGEKLYRVDLNPDEMLLHMNQLTWRYTSLPGLVDFKVDSDTDSRKMYGAVFVIGSTVRVVTLDFQRKEIQEKRRYRIRTMTAVLTNGFIIVHGKVLEEAFFICKTCNFHLQLV